MVDNMEHLIAGRPAFPGRPSSSRSIGLDDNPSPWKHRPAISGLHDAKFHQQSELVELRPDLRDLAVLETVPIDARDGRLQPRRRNPAKSAGVMAAHRVANRHLVS